MGFLSLYCYLQLLDALTTLAFLSIGVQEANPLVRSLMSLGPSPLAGLLMAKLIAVALGVYCWRQKRWKLLGKANWFYAGLIVWNLFALLASSPALAAS